MSYDIKIDNESGEFDLLDLDIVFDGRGQTTMISGSNKLSQDVNKVLLTNTGSNRFHKKYGSEIKRIIGQKGRPEYIQSVIRDTCLNAIGLYMSLQSDQSKYQLLNSDEYISEIKEIITDYLGDNPDTYPFEPEISKFSTFSVKISLLSMSNVTEQINLGIRL